MYLKIERTSPDNSWKTYTHGHWVIGHLTKRQLRWTKKFGYQNHFAVVFITMVRWVLIAFVLGMGCTLLDSEASKALQAPLLFACLFLAFINMFVSLAACEYAYKVLTDRKLVVNQNHPSWMHLLSVTCLSGLHRYHGEQAAVITKFFQDTAEHDELLKELNDEPDDYNRVVDDIRAKAKTLADEFKHLAKLDDIMTRTQEELAIDTTPFDEVLKNERKAELHERVNQLLNYQPR